jgi:hypothetical protein
MEATFDPPGAGRGDSLGVPSAKVLAFRYWRVGTNTRYVVGFRTRVIESGISYTTGGFGQRGASGRGC